MSKGIDWKIRSIGGKQLSWVTPRKRSSHTISSGKGCPFFFRPFNILRYSPIFAFFLSTAHTMPLWAETASSREPGVKQAVQGGHDLTTLPIAPWYLTDPQTGKIEATVYAETKKYDKVLGAGGDLIHRRTLYVRGSTELGTALSLHDLDGSCARQEPVKDPAARPSASGSPGFPEKTVPGDSTKGLGVCPQEDLYWTEEGSLRGYRFRDPTTQEGLMLFVHGQKAAVFDGTEALTWPEDRIARWLVGGPGFEKYAQNSDQKPAYWVDWGPDALVGAQLADSVLKQWKTLRGQAEGLRHETSKQKLVYDLFVPMKRGFLSFEAEIRDSQADSRRSPIDAGPESTVEVRVAAASWLIKPFAPEISFTFRCIGGDPQCKSPPSVLRYVGPSPIEIRGSRYPKMSLEERRGLGPKT